MADDDPFRHLHSRPTGPKLAKPDPDELGIPVDSRQYKAFEKASKPLRLIIQCRSQPSHSPSYGLLANVIFDRRFGGSFVLIFNFMTVTVTGRNLAAVIHAINHQACSMITEFDPRSNEAPAKGEPIIEGIEIVAGATVAEHIEVVAQARSA